MIHDILLTNDGDVDFSGGDISMATTERSTGQHKRDILMAAPGDFKEYPTLGIGAVEYIQDDTQMFLRDVRKQMQADGITITQVAFGAKGELIIEGGYEKD